MLWQSPMVLHWMTVNKFYFSELHRNIRCQYSKWSWLTRSHTSIHNMNDDEVTWCKKLTSECELYFIYNYKATAVSAATPLNYKAHVHPVCRQPTSVSVHSYSTKLQSCEQPAITFIQYTWELIWVSSWRRSNSDAHLTSKRYHLNDQCFQSFSVQSSNSTQKHRRNGKAWKYLLLC